MERSDPLFLPVILGTSRKGRRSAHVARFVASMAAKQPGVVTELIDIAELPLPADDAGEAIRDAAFAEKMERADGLVIVSPEYNHSFPGLLKHALDSCLEQYIHKPAAVVGVAAGPFGGARCIQSFLPVLRELGLVATFTDLYFGSVYDLFDEEGRLSNPAFERRTRDFLDELAWMAETLRWGRRNVGVDMGEEAVAAEPLPCPVCGNAMNHHADKPVEPRSEEEAGRVDPATGGLTLAAHTCPACGHAEARLAGAPA
jgi:NAD(P)H-dependent FMN reductase